MDMVINIVTSRLMSMHKALQAGATRLDGTNS